MCDSPRDDKDVAVVSGLGEAAGFDEAVGPGQPPKRTRFRKGVSGNPKGRPKGSKNLSTLFMEAANSEVVAVIDGRKRKITKGQAALMQLATKASQGERELAKFLDWYDEFEARAAAARPAQFPLEERDLEVLRAAYERMKQCNPDGATE